MTLYDTTKNATLHTQGWHGHTATPILVIGETPKNYRIRCLKRTKLSGANNWKIQGEEGYVPKYAVTLEGETP